MTESEALELQPGDMITTTYAAGYQNTPHDVVVIITSKKEDKRNNGNTLYRYGFAIYPFCRRIGYTYPQFDTCTERWFGFTNGKTVSKGRKSESPRLGKALIERGK